MVLGSGRWQPISFGAPVERRPRTKMNGEYHSVLGGRAVSDWGLRAETRIMNKHRQLGKAPALSCNPGFTRSEEHTSELKSLMRNSYAVFFLKKKKLK